VTITTPRSEGPGREKARAAILEELRRAGGADRVVVRVHSADGRDYTLGAKGGYRPATMARGIEDDGDDAFGYIADQLDGAGYEVQAGSVTSVTITYG
jgi:hypothetical protein